MDNKIAQAYADAWGCDLADAKQAVEDFETLTGTLPLTSSLVLPEDERNREGW